MKKKKKPVEKKKTGRPSEYTPKYCSIVTRLCLLGAKNEDIAKSFEISTSTLNDWMKRYPAFLNAIKAGRENADAFVADSLYHRALGYKHKAHKMQLDRSGNWKVKEYIEHYPPDPTAAIFWLKNRKPDQWREKLDIETKTITVKVADENDAERKG